MYFTDHADSNIRELDLNTKKVSPVVENLNDTREHCNFALALDEATEVLYVSEIDCGLIKKVNLKTHQVVVICDAENWKKVLSTHTAKRADDPHFAALALDDVEKYLYFADRNNMAIGRINVARNGPTIDVLCGGSRGHMDGTFFRAEFDNPCCLAWDQIGKILYVGQRTSFNIREIRLDTKTVSTLRSTELASKGKGIIHKGIWDMEIDVRTNYLYAVYDTNKILRIRLGDTPRITNFVFPQFDESTPYPSKSRWRGIVKDPQRDDLYVIDYCGHMIRKLTYPTKTER